MPRLTIPAAFKEALDRKPNPLAGTIAKCVHLLGENPRHPSLQTHPVRGTRNPKVFEAYVDKKNRVTWRWGESGVIVVLNHCNHEIMQRAPYGPPR